MKVVPDSMLWVSFATAKGGYRYRLIQQARRKRVRLFTSDYILAEVRHALVDYLRRTRRYALLAEGAIVRAARVIELPPLTRRFVTADPGDDPVILTALRAKAHYLVTSDNALLELRKVESLRILTPQQFEMKLKTEASAG